MQIHNTKFGYILDEIRKLKREHYLCFDDWYSCPLHPEGSSQGGVPKECNCGAEEYNQRIDHIIETLQQSSEDEERQRNKHRMNQIVEELESLEKVFP